MSDTMCLERRLVVVGVDFVPELSVLHCKVQLHFPLHLGGILGAWTDGRSRSGRDKNSQVDMAVVY